MKKIQTIMMGALLAMLCLSNVAFANDNNGCSGCPRRQRSKQGMIAKKGGPFHTFISATKRGIDSSGNAQLLPAGSAILFDTVVDDHGHIEYKNGVFTAHDTGLYEVTYGASFGNIFIPNAPIAQGALAVRINGVLQQASAVQSAGSLGFGGDWTTLSLIFKTTTDKTTFEIVNAGPVDTFLFGDFSHTVAFATIKKVH